MEGTSSKQYTSNEVEITFYDFISMKNAHNISIVWRHVY